MPLSRRTPLSAPLYALAMITLSAITAPNLPNLPSPANTLRCCYPGRCCLSGQRTTAAAAQSSAEVAGCVVLPVVQQQGGGTQRFSACPLPLSWQTSCVWHPQDVRCMVVRMVVRMVVGKVVVALAAVAAVAAAAVAGTPLRLRCCVLPRGQRQQPAAGLGVGCLWLQQDVAGLSAHSPEK